MTRASRPCQRVPLGRDAQVTNKFSSSVRTRHLCQCVLSVNFVMKWKATLTSASLCALFLVFYNASNYITSLRHDVGAFYFSWERYIPFVPIFIVPYMSIDLFFIGAPFLARNDIELRTLRRR